VVRRRRCLICDHRFYTIQQLEVLLPKEAFRWVERKGQRHTVELLGADGR
jgi:transcriptional regulator NrdR family protein